MKLFERFGDSSVKVEPPIAKVAITANVAIKVRMPSRSPARRWPLPDRQQTRQVIIVPHPTTISARDRLEQILSRLNDRRSEEKTFTRLYVESARREADASDRRRQTGAGLGPLDGKIVSIKDLFDVAGEPTLAGSIIRRNSPPAQKMHSSSSGCAPRVQ